MKNTIETDDVFWTDGEETEFEVEMALAHLLMNRVVFSNSLWFKKDVPEIIKKSTTLFVECNDVFAWGCADGEVLPHSEIRNLYGMWLKDDDWGAAVWCMKQRNKMPQPPVEELIRKAGIWDLDSMNLEPN